MGFLLTIYEFHVQNWFKDSTICRTKTKTREHANNNGPQTLTFCQHKNWWPLVVSENWRYSQQEGTHYIDVQWQHQKKKRRIGFVCQNLKMTRYEGLKQDDIHTRWSHPPSTSIKHHQMVLNLWFHLLHPTHVVSFGSVLYEWKRLRNYHMGKLYLNLEVVHCIVPRPYPSFGWTQPNFGLLQMVPSCKLIKTDLSIGISRITPTAIGLISVNLANINHPWITNSSRYIGMDQYLLIPFLGEWTSIYQLFWCSPGVQGFDTLPYHFKVPFLVVKSTCLVVKSWEIHTFWSPRSVPPVAYLHGHQTPDLASQQFTHIEPGSPWILSLGFAHPDPSKKKNIAISPTKNVNDDNYLNIYIYNTYIYIYIIHTYIYIRLCVYVFMCLCLWNMCFSLVKSWRCGPHLPMFRGKLFPMLAWNNCWSGLRKQVISQKKTKDSI